MPVIFKAITPKPFKPAVFELELRKAMESVEAGILKDYKEGVKTWDTKVQFTSKTTVNAAGISIEVDTDNEIYGYVHEGVGPHVIAAKKAKRLRFQGTYTAKTTPGTISARSGGPSGGFQTARQVQHPGFPGRFFSRPIKKKWGPYMVRQGQRAMERAAKASGHAMLSLIIIIVAIGVILWAINQYIPMEANVKKLLNIVVIVVIV